MFLWAWPPLAWPLPGHQAAHPVRQWAGQGGRRARTVHAGHLRAGAPTLLAALRRLLSRLRELATSL